jgi:hypothetical protein
MDDCKKRNKIKAYCFYSGMGTVAALFTIKEPGVNAVYAEGQNMHRVSKNRFGCPDNWNMYPVWASVDVKKFRKDDCCLFLPMNKRVPIRHIFENGLTTTIIEVSLEEKGMMQK